MSVHGYPAVTAFCCLFCVVLGLCVGVSPSLQFFSVISPSVWCLSVVTNGHTSSDWSPGPMLVDVHLGVYVSWLGRFWSLFLVLFCFYVFFFDKGGLIVFITTPQLLSRKRGRWDLISLVGEDAARVLPRDAPGALRVALSRGRFP